MNGTPLVPDRLTIANLIIDLLRRAMPLRARHIAARIRDEAPDVTVHDVNSVLYRELADTVVQNGSYEWAVRQSGGTTLQHLIKTAEELDQRASYLRAVQRLRAGLPPQEHIGELTVGNHQSTITDLLTSRPGSRRWMLVTGDYGHGKSHTLTLVEHEARRQGYATCHLSADAAASALNHPQRFLPLLLSTLDVPCRAIQGYQDFLHELLDDVHATNAIASFVAQRLADTTALRRDLDARFQALRRAANDDRLTRKQAIISLLTGDSINARLADPAVRSQAYELLGVAQDTVKIVGAKGIALIIDEAESIYTKLPSSLSRYGAFKVLSALTNSSHLPNCCLAIAVTPDALQQLQTIDIRAVNYGCLPTEPVAEWARDLRERNVPIIHCQPLSTTDKITLLTNVATVYTTGYPNVQLQDAPGTAWHNFRTTTATATIPVRIAIRRAVDYLDIQRCALRAHTTA
jgi:hypothetical protein